MTDYSTHDRRRHLTVSEVAVMWGVSEDKVYADLRKGALPHYRVPPPHGAIRVRYADALAYGGRPLVDAPSSSPPPAA